ncbi:AbiJ-NTD4 domain-containing protein [Aureimonas psammosilenae]|uniref:AbiJ-NTD4 domain-containing protein n=1 Tax=Aureimonas psammosilenae TaxID=2495496 RepID=UPI00186A0ABB|nr:hypothetical protein [Aureimonas psammosilenae]
MLGFSERHGYEAPERPIVYREDASGNLREMLVELAEKHGLSPHTIRSILCGLLFVAPDASNWTPYPNVDGECRILLHDCLWNEVYDAAELFAREIYDNGIGHETALAFQHDINRLFLKDGAGWKMQDGIIIARGSEPFNVATVEAQTLLAAKKQATAASEIHEAIRDISRRPHPDRTGAVHHAMGAIECLTRSLSGDPKATLGEIVGTKGKQHGIPAPLDQAVTKLWGYTSEHGRHVREQGEPSFEEAELIVTVSAAICTYLARKMP